ncbi:hypothetical protein [Paenibacillus sp. PL2-23]|uniref:hypothetical protein n=1 Tax=Paenibacillus sp. PL2-23 TaxID=2100729 RepID=UPI0030FA5126
MEHYRSVNTKESTGVEIITIHSGDIEIPYVSRLVNAIDNPDHRPDTFDSLTNNQSEIPYLQLGEEIQLILNKAAPVSQTLVDEILNEDGTRKYNELSAREVFFQFDDKLGIFINIAQDTPVFYKRGRNGRPALAGMIFGVFLFSLLC